MSTNAAGNAAVATGLQLGAATVCAAADAGTLRWNATAKAVEVCDGTNWTGLGSGSTGGGTGTALDPALSCLALKTAVPTASTGAYWIDPDGAGPIQSRNVYCDMSTHGGGWTLVSKTNGSDNNHVGANAVTPANLTSPSTASSGYIGDDFRLAMGTCHMITSGGITLYAHITNTLSMSSWWGHPNTGITWATTYGTTAGHYTDAAIDDAGSSGHTVGPAKDGRNWARPTSYVGSGLFAGGNYGFSGTMFVKNCIP